jgi:hypothetical protein
VRRVRRTDGPVTRGAASGNQRPWFAPVFRGIRCLALAEIRLILNWRWQRDFKAKILIFFMKMNTFLNLKEKKQIFR